MCYFGTVTHRQTGAPICGVTVTDGRNVVKTDENGAYSLPGWERSHWVAVCMLTCCHDDWYHYTGGREGGYDFALTPAAAAAPFDVLQTSDTEINSTCTVEWLDDLRLQIREEAPSLLMHTGDICGREGLARHRQVMNCDTMGCPVRYVVGNHDFVPSDAEYGEQLFEQLYGPLWWSFDLGGVHCIVLSLGHGGRKDMPSGYPREDQWCWLRNELDSLPAGTRLAVFCHDAGPDPYEFVVGQMDLKQAGLLAWIYGHAHSNLHHIRSGVHLICTGRPNSGGIDASAAGPRRIRITDGEVSSQMRYWRLPAEPADPALWRTKVPGKISFCEPVLHRGRIYVGTARDEHPATAGISCLDAVDGSLCWFFETQGGMHNNIALDEDRLYAQDCMGDTYCLNASDGTLL